MSQDASIGPRWVNELRRSLGYKTLFLLSGNVYDRYPYALSADAEAVWHPLREFLRLSLHDWGYRVVGFFDIVDGLSFAGSGDDERLFGEILPKGTTRPSDESRTDPSACLDVLRPVLGGDTPCVFVLDYAALLGAQPDYLLAAERPLFVKIAKAAEEAKAVPVGDPAGGRKLCNALVLVTEKPNAVPAWLYLHNPRVKVLEAERPSDDERRAYFQANGLALHAWPSSPDERRTVVGQLVDLSQGLTNLELRGLVDLSRQERVPAREARRLIELYKFGQRSSPWVDLETRDDKREALANAEARLTERVKGQSAAVRAAADLLKRAALGLSGIQQATKGGRPKGVLFFAGPTGTGKTELAKAIADLIFGSEDACLRFDMSEYGQEHSDQRFFGSPPGYVGYEVGGELTNKVKARPFSVLLFDEIEKAHPKILDKFLQILDDGRLTSGQGETVYFSECLIIFTSNKGIYRESRGPGGVMRREPAIRPEGWRCSACGRFEGGEEPPERCPSENCDRGAFARVATPYEEIRRGVLRELQNYFKLELGRPELYNRLGNNFVVFDYIRPDVVAEIVDKMLGTVVREVEARRGIRVAFADAFRHELIRRAASDLELGGRGIGNLIETIVVNPLARQLFDGEIGSGTTGGTRVSITEFVEEPATHGAGYRLKCSVESPGVR